MANDSERPIEKLLRAAAKTRREEAGGPFELHPATRRLLQGEVAREHRQRPQEPVSLAEVLVRLWPRLAWAIGIFLVLGFAAWMVIPRGGGARGDLAMNRADSEAAQKKNLLAEREQNVKLKANMPAEAATATTALADKGAAIANAPSPPSALNLIADSALRHDLPRTAASESPALHAPKDADLAMAESGAKTVVEPSAAASSFQRRYGLDRAASPPPPAGTDSITAAPAAVPRSLAFARTEAIGGARAQEKVDAKDGAQQFARGSVEKQALPVAGFSRDAGAIRQKFVGVVDKAADKPTRSRASGSGPVLSSFMVEQSGRVLRVTDADGSVYAGSLKAPVQATARPVARQPAAPRPTAAPGNLGFQETNQDAIAQYYAFQVIGTNRSLKQKVVFSGNLLPLTNNSGNVTNIIVGTALNTTGDAAASLPFAPLLHSQISGKLKVGSQPEVQLKAVPVNP